MLSVNVTTNAACGAPGPFALRRSGFARWTGFAARRWRQRRAIRHLRGLEPERLDDLGIRRDQITTVVRYGYHRTF